MAGVWTRNYYNLLTANMLGDTTTTSTNTPTDYDPPIRVRTHSGSYVTPACEGVSQSINGVVNGVSGLAPLNVMGKRNAYVANSPIFYSDTAVCITFGTGTTPASYEDYRVETPVSGLTIVSQAGTLTQPSAYDNVTHHYYSERKFTANNSTAANITITEVGLYVPASTNANPTLVYREVLDTPITLAPGESVIISFARNAEVYNYTPY